MHLPPDVMRSHPYSAFSLLLALTACGGEDQGPSGRVPSYARLSETGLYSNLETRTLAPGVLPFEPSFELWSDGADKARWIALPEGTTIDTTDMNRWVFPIGTRVWKEFSLGGARLETRLIERWGAGPSDYWMGAFVSEGSADAVLAEQGAEDVLGTEHDVPARERCSACHNGEPGRVLGFSALQLARSSSAPDPERLDLARLTALGLLSSPPSGAGDSLAASAPSEGADTATEAGAALGYLHANCGSCHNARGTAWPDTQMVLRLDADGEGVRTSAVLDSLVGRRLQYFRDQVGDITLRVVAGHPESSGIVARMGVRGPKEQMPPLATERVDAVGVALVSRWIAALPE